jgi:Phage tail protein (Tail_P2_I)
MTDVPDNYAIYYADKLWNLLPAVYRAQDTDQFGSNGPLREVVNRIGAQVANVRRNIDRMWEDQSIETCDDWAIPYLSALLGANLVSGLDARAQRIDVAKTIYYRRRKGTVAILEEIASAITGWDAKVVEFFRRMGRTRHGLDPAIGPSPLGDDDETRLQVAEGLVGPITRTAIGGFADLRDVYGASKAGTAFDEYFHTADMRKPLGSTGWYNIPRLGVFLWRLKSYGVGPVTPVPVLGCPGWYTFDPTGRDIPLFAAGRGNDGNAFGDNWVSPAEAQLPTPISQQLLDTNAPVQPVPTPAQMDAEDAAYWRRRTQSGADQRVNLYPDDLSVTAVTDPPAGAPIPSNQLRIRPERGRFLQGGSPPPATAPVVAYHYGFPSDIGAGPYDRRIDTLAIGTPAPAVAVSGGGSALAASGSIPSAGALTIQDSLTYSGAANVGPLQGALTLQSENQQRPLIRLGGAGWSIEGVAGTSLVLDGLFVSGGDVVLRGAFDAVALSCCTLDPGTASQTFGSATGSPPAALFGTAGDGVNLAPTRLWIEANVKSLLADRCVLAALGTRNGGLVETVKITNSTLQAIPTSGDGVLAAADVKDPALQTRLFDATNPLSLDRVANALLAMAPGIVAALGLVGSPPQLPQPTVSPQLLAALNQIVSGPSIYDPASFAGIPLSDATLALLSAGSPPASALALNRALLADAFPRELADCALAFSYGMISLSRCTVLGRIAVHRIDASECILWDLAGVDDAQAGCVRFSAWADGSILPRKFESVRVRQRQPLFTTVDFGRPSYCQLGPLVDDAILPDTGSTSPAPPNTISGGAVDGSEMGAFARDKNPIKEQGLIVKYQEYMPAGLAPVIIHAT